MAKRGRGNKGKQRSGTREVYRGLSEQELDKLERNRTPRSPAAPRLLAAEEPFEHPSLTRTRQLRKDLSQITLGIIERTPSHVRGYGQTSRRMIELSGLTIDLWGSEVVDRSFSLFSSRLHEAADMVVEDHVRRGSLRRDVIERVRGFSYPALSTGFGSQAFREIIGQRPHLELLHFLDQHDGARRRSDRTEGINSDERQKAMRATAQGVLRDRLAERNKIDAQRISAIADRVISIWTSPNAVAIAAGLQTQWPEGDYRRVNERIDWCVIYDEQMKRDGRLPGDTGQIISGALQAACAEAGLDYMVCNAISSRPEGLFTA